MNTSEKEDKRFSYKFSLNNIQVRLNIILVLTTTIILTGFALFRYFTTKADLRRDMNDHSEIIVSDLSKTVAMPLWNFNMKEVGHIVNSAMVDERIYAIIIRDKDGKNITYGIRRDNDNKTVIEAKDNISGNYHVRIKETSEGKDQLGTVEIYLTYDYIKKRLKASLIDTFITFIILNFALICVLFISIGKGVIQPISYAIENLSIRSNQMYSFSEQIASASQSLARGVSEQAAAAQQTSSSLEEVTLMIRQNADNSVQVHRFMETVSGVIERVNEKMNKLTVSMEETIRASQETSGIIKTIDGIAFQTNLLALNAAIEAARVGDVGGGFAIVADEVRKLAMSAAQAAKNTSDLIEITLKKARIGGETASETLKDFSEVIDYAHKAGERIADIARTSDDQALRIGHLNSAVEETGKVTQNNAAIAEETSAASEEMKLQVEEIKIIVNGLNVLIGKKATD